MSLGKTHRLYGDEGARGRPTRDVEIRRSHRARGRREFDRRDAAIPVEFPVVTEQTMQELERLLQLCDPLPWRSSVEDRDHYSSASMIMTGSDDRRGEDIYASRDSGPAGAVYLDLIAGAVTALPSLLAEVRSARGTSRATGAGK